MTKEHLLISSMQEGDHQIWGQVIKIYGQRDAPRDRHMQICDRNHELQTFLD